jgi:putative nucleotidyltransferase with HDIG domain
MGKDDGRRWRSRPLLSRLIRATVFLTPIGLSIGVASVVAAVMPQPTTTAATIVWWAAFMIALAIPMALSTHLLRRVLPLAALLELTLVFPDEAPSRFAVAKAAGRTRQLKRRLAATASNGEPNEAAHLVLALIHSLGDHDRRTRGHSERVRAFTDMLAEQAGVPAEDREKLRWGALLHDIGKLEVSPEILNKAGEPDEDEWQVLRKHPIEGARLLGPLRDWLGPWIGAVTHHHEHWDGTGYALGLKEEEISLGGRILAIADSYEVMTAARPYKKPIAPEAARRELAKCAGTHFDPHLVRCFLEISIGRLWRTIGAAAFIAQLPVLGGLSYKGLTQRLGRASATVAGTALAVTGLVTSGLVNAPALPRHPTAVQLASPDAAAEDPSSDEDRDDPTNDQPGRSSEDDQRPEKEADESDVPTHASDPQAPTDPEGEPDEDPDPSPPPDDDEPPDDSVPAYTSQGQITAASALEPNAGGATESDFISGCSVPSTQGVDAWVFDLGDPIRGPIPAGVTGMNELGSAALGGRAYDGSCRVLRGFDNGTEWSLPKMTRYVVVVAPRGLDTGVTLRIAG